jgi:hypothetical protein
MLLVTPLFLRRGGDDHLPCRCTTVTTTLFSVGLSARALLGSVTVRTRAGLTIYFFMFKLLCRGCHWKGRPFGAQRQEAYAPSRTRKYGDGYTADGDGRKAVGPVCCYPGREGGLPMQGPGRGAEPEGSLVRVGLARSLAQAGRI